MSRYVHSGRSSNYRGNYHSNHQSSQLQQHQPDTYGGSSSNNSLRFALSDSDFQRDAVLKRQRYLSPGRVASAATTATTTTYPQQPSHRTSGGTGTRETSERPVPSSAARHSESTPAPARGRSKSKSRARQPSAAHPPKPSSAEFIALGQRAHTTNTYRATYHGSSRGTTTRSRSRSIAAAAAASRQHSSSRAPQQPEEEEETRGRTREREDREREALPVPPVALAKATTKKATHRSTADEKARSKSQSTRSKSTKSSRSKSARRTGHSRSTRSTSSSSSSSSSSEDERRRASHKRSMMPRKASAKRTSPSPAPSRYESNRRRSTSKATTVRRTDDRQSQKGKSKSRTRASSAERAVDRTASIDAEISSTQRALSDAKKDLQQLLDDTKAKQYEIQNLELDLEMLEKRKQINADFRGTRPADDDDDTSHHGSRSRPRASASHHRDSEQRKRSVSRTRPVSRRPCIVDTDESDDDDEVVILDPLQVKHEQRQVQKRPRSASASRSTKTRTASASALPLPVQVPSDMEKKDIPDYFWGKGDSAVKLLSQYRVRKINDGHVRKMRHLAFNPSQSDYFATSSDDGGVNMWNYERPSHEISKIATFAPTSFRSDNQCAESIAWSPDGNRLAMAFRDSLHGQGEFCVVLLHQLTLTESETPQDIPRERITSVATTLHPRGISAVEWIPVGYGSETTSRSLVTSGPDHAVVLWEEHNDASKEYKWSVLHREHRSEVKAICVHSQRQALYTGGLDGQVIRYDMNQFAPTVVLERRKPSISKINAVLEHPHNPHLLLVSCVEQAEHSILLHDLRERYSSSRDATMTLSWVKSSDSRSMSQYIVPRWSPAGLHVSCGSTSGVVNIWDVRVRGPSYPVVQPMQAIAAHGEC